MKKNEHFLDQFVVIMAGGRGERFWPLSRANTPKQLLTLLGRRSFLQAAVDRVLPLVPRPNIFIITNQAQVAAVRKQLPNLPRENIVAEPVGRDTCAAVALGAALVGARAPAGVMAVLPADHVIPAARPFQQVLADAFAVAARDRVIVTIGIKPSEPATGYGYIRTGTQLPPPAGVPKPATTFFEAEAFVEKPDHDTAVAYLQSGLYRWNAGMFVWSYPTITEGLQRHQPEMAAACRRWADVARHPAKLARLLAADYPALTKISIDFALMEQARNVVCADGAFDWDDLGAWPALARHLPPDAQGNCGPAEIITVDSARNLVFDARTRRRTPVTLVGLSDTIVVQTDDAVLIAPKNQAQKIKELVKKLGADKKWRHLM